MKTYTDLPQSKKLAEILPLESADMCYPKDAFEYHYAKEPVCHYSGIGLAHPCWSLAALLNIINNNYYTSLYHDGIAWNIEVTHHDNVKDKHSVYAGTPIDACYELILKLHEQKVL